MIADARHSVLEYLKTSIELSLSRRVFQVVNRIYVQEPS